MAEIVTAGVDPVQELSLRRWARENYVPQDNRSMAWHPIVLEEMRVKEFELLASSVEP